jgi:hypothetical protein
LFPEVSMVALAKQSPSRKPARRRQKLFLAMLPAIVAHARAASRHLAGDDRDDMIQEVIANSFVAFTRLAELNKLDLAYPGVLARYAVAQIHAGRRVGNKLNIRDVASPYAQRMKGIHLERLDRYDPVDQQWQEVLVEDRHAGPFDIVRIKLDFTAWLRSLPSKLRRIAKTLDTGERTGDVALRFGLSESRVSQLRRELAASWEAFVGESPIPAIA